MRTLVILIALIVLGLGLGFLFLGDAPTAEAPTTTPETETTPDTSTNNETTTTSPAGSDDESTDDNAIEGGTDVGAEFPILDTEDETGATYDALVTYTDDGFTPETVTIQAGETVRFVNESSRDMWVGSDNHPTHTLYPGSSTDDCLGSSFDQCEGTGSGTFFTFTFTEVGTWGYHNHVRSSHGGVIIVE